MYSVMTEQEKEELRCKMEARNGNMNNNQQTCSGCGSVIPSNYDVCPVCGKVLRQGVKQVPNAFEQRGQVQSGGDEPGKGFAIASVVLGGVGLLLVWFIGFIGPICGGIGYALAEKAIERGCQSGLPKIGRILSIVAMAIGSVLALVMILFMLILSIGGGNGAVFATLLGFILGIVIAYGIAFGIAILIGWLIKKYV